MSARPRWQPSRGGFSRSRGARSRRSKRSQTRPSRLEPFVRVSSSTVPWVRPRASSFRSPAHCTDALRSLAPDSDATQKRRVPSPSRSTWPHFASPPAALPRVATRTPCSSPRPTRRRFVPRGRVYGQVGLLLAGVYSQGPDRGIAQGAHGGVGIDLYGGRVMWNLNSRLLWLRRNSGENVFGVQLGVSVSPRIGGRGR